MLIGIYIMMTLATGISALHKGALYAGVAGLVGPTLCWWAASGFKGCLLAGDDSQKIGGLAMGTIFVIGGVGIVYHSGFWIWTGRVLNQWCGVVRRWLHRRLDKHHSRARGTKSHLRFTRSLAYGST